MNIILLLKYSYGNNFKIIISRRLITGEKNYVEIGTVLPMKLTNMVLYKFTKF